MTEIGVGMLGYAFMGKAHSNAYHKLAYMTWPPPLAPRLVTIAGRDEAAVSEAARRYGFERYATDWRELVGDGEVELFDNGGPNNLHAEPTIAAAEAGKHVVCEKPLGRGGADGTIEASRFAPGRKNALAWEINGSKGSLAFDLERLNELLISNGTAGFRTRLVSETDDPFWEWWWPHGHVIGWEHTFVHEL